MKRSPCAKKVNLRTRRTIRAADIDFADRVALIAEGGCGIRRATALAPARGAADVLANYLQNADAAAETVQVIRRFGRKATAVAADAGKRQEVERLFEKIQTGFCWIDIISNAKPRTLQSPLGSFVDSQMRFADSRSLNRRIKTGCIHPQYCRTCSRN